MVREEKVNGVLGPRQLYYYFNGKRIGDVSNNGPSANVTDYATQLAGSGSATTIGKGGFRNGRPVASADFDQNYQPINSGYPAAAATSYTVQAGDTLRSIAQAVWGDAAMWYLIAESNGLTSSSALIAGPRRTSSMVLAARPMGWSWPTEVSEVRPFQETTARPA